MRATNNLFDEDEMNVKTLKYTKPKNFLQLPFHELKIDLTRNLEV